MRLTHVQAQSLAAALAAFIAVTPLAGADAGDDSDHDPRAGARLAGVRMPDTGPGSVPVDRLNVVVRLAGRGGRRAWTAAETARLGSWLQEHHGRARLAVVSDSSVTRDSNDLARPDVKRATESPRRAVRHAVSGATGKDLVIMIGGKASRAPLGAASLVVRSSENAPPPRPVSLHVGEEVHVRVDARRQGALAASAAYAVISVAELQPAP